jgi:hypothetical protein
MKNKGAWIGFAGLIIAALISGFFILRSNPDSKQINNVSQKVDSGTSNFAARDLNQAGHDVYTAGHDLKITNYNGDTSKRKREKSGGDTYNVTSNNQKGGLTVGKLIINKNVTLVVKGDSSDSGIVPNNFQVEIDTLTQIITMQPKIGSWTTPFIGIPASEEEFIEPHFSSKNKVINAKKFKAYYSKIDTLAAMTTGGSPSTKDFFYSLHYVNLPSYVIFGNYPGPLYRINLK